MFSTIFTSYKPKHAPLLDEDGPCCADLGAVLTIILLFDDTSGKGTRTRKGKIGDGKRVYEILKQGDRCYEMKYNLKGIPHPFLP